MSSLTNLHPDIRDYARQLIGAGFTVYGPAASPRRPQEFFYYSQAIEGREYYGVFSRGASSFEGPSHSMPIAPSRLNGSSAHVGARWGDEATLGMGSLSPLSIEYARIVARPANWCPYNAEPTAEAVARANAGGSVPKRFYRGAMLPNARPWGLEHSEPVTL